jgi:hypothetical protein
MNAFKKSALESWELEIAEKYPLVFLETFDSEVDYVNLRYGFECESGWTKHIEEIATMATEIVLHFRSLGLSKEEAYIHSCIVKEKFGTMRWQGGFKLPNPFGDLWMSYYSSVESSTAYTCELTGKYGRPRNKVNGKSAWVKALCDEKAKELGYDITDDGS